MLLEKGLVQLRCVPIEQAEPHRSRLTTKFSDRTLTVQHAGARRQAAREARPPAAEHFMVMRLAATRS
jgi:hypothetical protein